MSAQDLFFQLYHKFLEQKSVLPNAPALAMDAPDIARFDLGMAQTELAAVVSYLLGIQDVNQIAWEEALDLVQKHYATQPEWQKLLLEYFDCVLEKEKEDLLAEQKDLLKDLLDTIQNP